jgi:hypothetical protein
MATTNLSADRFSTGGGGKLESSTGGRGSQWYFFEKGKVLNRGAGACKPGSGGAEVMLTLIKFL